MTAEQLRQGPFGRESCQPVRSDGNAARDSHPRTANIRATGRNEMKRGLEIVRREADSAALLGACETLWMQIRRLLGMTRNRRGR